MSSLPDVVGVQAPRLRVVGPSGSREDGEDASALVAGYGLTLDAWQQDVLGDWLAADGRGVWVHDR